MTHVACLARAGLGGVGGEAVLLIGHRLRAFTPQLLTQTADHSFFSECPHCGLQHISQAPRQEESFTLECPGCSRVYALVAADNHGRRFHAPEFLTGYEPPSHFPPGQTRMEQLLTIWRAVHQNCEYENDPEIDGQRTDRWQTALETQMRGAGDCEDSAIFLADWLLARGFEARVVLGRFEEVGGHAWVVAILEGEEYLLESTTEAQPDGDLPPTVRSLGKRYQPEVQFDRWQIFVHADPRRPSHDRYWDNLRWLAVEPPRSMEPVEWVAGAPLDDSLWGLPVGAPQSVRHSVLATVLELPKPPQSAAPAPPD
jgi:predicted transglutaminase-like cysteine proteinase